MAQAAQMELLPASVVAQQTPIQQAANRMCYAMFADTHISSRELEEVVQAVPNPIAAALNRHAYYFVPLAIAEAEQTMVAPSFTVALGDRAICHRNVHYDGADCLFISTRLMQDRFALAFEFFINVGHHFVEAVGAPSSFGDLVWSQALADIRGETSQDTYDSRRRALDWGRGESVSEKRFARMAEGTAARPAQKARTDDQKTRIDERAHDEKARNSFVEGAFSDILAIYMLSLTLDFNYADLRERQYPLLAAPALAERLRHVAGLFPPNPGYEFQICYRRK